MNYKDLKNLKKGQQINYQIKNDWEIDESLIGKLVAVNQVTFEAIGDREGSTQNGYVFETDEGRFQCVLGASDKGLDIKIGYVYEIIFKGKKPIAQGRNVNIFEVFYYGKAEEELD